MTSTPRVGPAFQFYASDFLASTAGWEPDEVGAMVRLLCIQWAQGHIPFRPESVRRCAGVYEDWERIWSRLEAKFPESSGGRANSRLEEVRDEQVAYRLRQSEAGKKGAAKRYGSDSNPIATLAGSPKPAHGNPTPTPKGTLRQSDSSSPSPSPSPSSTSTSTQPEEPEPALRFPVKGKGKEWALSLAKLVEYREAYPALDVVGEFRKARQWLRDNRANRKAGAGMPAFLTRWLNRATSGASVHGLPERHRSVHDSQVQVAATEESREFIRQKTKRLGVAQ